MSTETNIMTSTAGPVQDQGLAICGRGRLGGRRSEILLKGLELFREYYSLGVQSSSLDAALRSLEPPTVRTGAPVTDEEKEEAVAQTIQELRDINRIVDKYQGSQRALIQILLEIQAQYNWLPDVALMWVSARLGVPWSRIYHIATFYKAFSLVPRGKHLVQVCLGTACHVRGGPRLLDKVVEVLSIQPGETDRAQLFSLLTVNCLGCCALGPVMVVDGRYHSNPSQEQIQKMAAGYLQK